MDNSTLFVCVVFASFSSQPFSQQLPVKSQPASHIIAYDWPVFFAAGWGPLGLTAALFLCGRADIFCCGTLSGHVCCVRSASTCCVLLRLRPLLLLPLPRWGSTRPPLRRSHHRRRRYTQQRHSNGRSLWKRMNRRISKSSALCRSQSTDSVLLRFLLRSHPRHRHYLQQLLTGPATTTTAIPPAAARFSTITLL